MIYSLCQSPHCKYLSHSLSQATDVISTSLQNSCNFGIWLSCASSRTPLNFSVLMCTSGFCLCLAWGPLACITVFSSIPLLDTEAVCSFTVIKQCYGKLPSTYHWGTCASFWSIGHVPSFTCLQSCCTCSPTHQQHERSHFLTTLQTLGIVRLNFGQLKRYDSIDVI